MSKFIVRSFLLAALLCGSALAQFGSHDILYVAVAPSGSCSGGSRLEKLTTGAGTVYACQTINGSNVGTWTSLASGSATGTVTSIGLVGTANQITITGSSPITGSGSWTLSLPSAVTMPGTLNVTGNLTTNMAGTALCVQETNGVLSATAAGCGGAGFPGAGIGLSTGSAWGTSLTAFGSAVGVATTSDPGTTAEVPMVANGTHGTKPSASGALQTGAFTAAYVLPAATSSVLGGVKPDGTSVLNTAGAISVTPTSIGLGNVTNNAQVTSVTGTPNQIAVSGTTTPTLSITSPFTFPGNATLGSANVLGWNGDSGISRLAGNSLVFGNNTQGDASGTVGAAVGNFGTSLTVGSASNTVLGTASSAQGFACGSGTMAVTAGYWGLRCDLASSIIKMVLPGGSGEYTSLASYAIAPAAAGGTGIANAVTLTLGTSPINLASQASGLVYNTTTTGALTAANFHQVSGPIVATDTSASATAYTATTSPSLASLNTGDLINFCGINQGNSGAATITINGSSAIPIKKWQNTALVANDMLASKCVLLRYDGTNFELDTIGNPPGGTGTVTVVGAGSLTSTAIVTGGGTTTLQTPSATSTLDASGNMVLAGALNKVTVTAPGTGSTLTIADGKTLTATNTMNVSKQAGIAGGIPWYDTTTSQSSSALLTANVVIKGGGSGAAPSGSSITDNGTLISTTEPLTLTPGARTTGALSYMIVNAPADTGITTATESVGINHVGATRTWVDGTVATQREYLFQAPTYNKTTTSATFTKAATLAVSAAPIAGTGVTITNGYSIWAQAGLAQFDGGVAGTTGNFSSTLAATGHVTFEGVTSTGATGTGKLVFDTAPTVNGMTYPTAAGSAVVAQRIASGTSALGTGAITSGTCATVVTTTATGTATTDVIGWGFNGDPTAVTGYAPTANGMLTIVAYPSSGNVNFKVCNNTSASVTPGAITLNWSVIR